MQGCLVRRVLRAPVGISRQGVEQGALIVVKPGCIQRYPQIPHLQQLPCFLKVHTQSEGKGFLVGLDAGTQLLNSLFLVKTPQLLLYVGGQPDQCAHVADVASDSLGDPVEAVGAEAEPLLEFELLGGSDQS